MDSYKVVMTDKAQEMLDSYTDYLTNVKLDPDSADNVFLDALGTINTLESTAGSFGYCKNPKLAALKYKKIFFNEHDYVFIYKIFGNTAVIEAMYHQLQDYENRFLEELDL